MKPAPTSFIVDPATGCWNWQRGTRRGYGVKRVDGRKMSAHRIYYERLVGPIPDGLTLDHLCRNRACVNPDHLEPVSMRENILRGVGPTARNSCKTHCVHGHALTAANTYVDPNGGRSCRTCRRAAVARYEGRTA